MQLIDFSGSQPSKWFASKRLKAALGVTALLGASLLGTTLASNISLNGGGNVEFGQGVATTTACDDSVTVTPISTFVNSEYSNTHTFSGVSLSTIDSTSEHCDGKDFIIRAYSNSAQQDIFSSGGSSYNTLRVYDDGGTFYVISEGSDYEEMSSDGDNSGNLTDTAFTVTFVSPLAAAEDIQKITVETVDHIDTGLISYAGHSYQLIENGLSWYDAYLDITTPVAGQCKYRLNGKCGYFATITSDAERIAVIANVGDGEIWLGGSDIESEGDWKWIDGPEFGSFLSAGFRNWNNNEPNDSGGNEDALQTLAGLAGQWNDLPTTGIGLRYLIEYSPGFTTRTNRLSLG